jgi:hypothetical protein
MTTAPALRAAHTLALSEPTVQDLVLAEALGYQRLTDIRKLISRHADLLVAMGSLRQRAAMIEVGKGAHRPVTEYHLTKAQAAFIIAKSGTKRAESLTALMAEVFAMVREGQLVPTDANASAELAASIARERERQRAINEEERAARSDAFAMLGRGRARKKYRGGVGT